MRCLITVAVVLVAAYVGWAQDAAPAEEKPYDERGFVQDYTNLSLSFTSGSTSRYDYEDLRIYLTGNAHYAFKGDDYLDLSLFINKLDRSYDNPRYNNGDISSIFSADLTYVFHGVDKYEYGFRRTAGITFFSDTMFEDVDFGAGYGVAYRYPEGNLRLLVGMGRNLGYADAWAPLADFTWEHNKRLSPQWTLRTRADVTWTRGREAPEPDEPADPDAVYLLDGTLSYQLIKGWSIYLRYFNDNSSDYAREYWSVGLSHYYRPPRRRPQPR